MDTLGISHVSFMHMPRMSHTNSIQSLWDYIILNHNCLWFNHCAKDNQTDTKSLLNTNISCWKLQCSQSTVIKENQQISNQIINHQVKTLICHLCEFNQSISQKYMKHHVKTPNIAHLYQSAKSCQTLAIVIKYCHILTSMVKS